MPAIKRTALILGAAASLCVIGALWSLFDRVGNDALPFDAKIVSTEAYGQDAGKGNLLGVQPWVVPGDYTNAATLTAKFSAYLQTARDKGWLSAKTVAVFPEYTGTWLIASGEKRSMYVEPKSEEAMRTVAFTHLPQFAYRLLTAPQVADKEKWALFTIKGRKAAAVYQTVFGTLARQYGINIVAGSIILPEPELVDGQLIVHPGGRLFNVSAVFDPSGRILAPLVVKAFPILDEQVFIASGRADALPVFDTAAGKLGVLICADAWYPPAYATLQKAGATLLAVPSYSTGDGIWSTHWGGYNGGEAPADVNVGDIGRISEGDAWMKYAMPGRAHAAGIQAGLNVFLRGQLWDLGSDGATIRVSGADSGHGAMEKGAVLTNLWLH